VSDGHEPRLCALPSSRKAGLRAGRQSAVACKHGHESRYYFGQVGYFLSPLDLLKECLTFFRFKAAFKRLVFFRLFMFSSTRTLALPLLQRERGRGNYLTNQIPETISAVPTTLGRVTPHSNVVTINKKTTRFLSP